MNSWIANDPVVVLSQQIDVSVTKRVLHPHASMSEEYNEDPRAPDCDTLHGEHVGTHVQHLAYDLVNVT